MYASDASYEIELSNDNDERGRLSNYIRRFLAGGVIDAASFRIHPDIFAAKPRRITPFLPPRGGIVA
jgi:hypothetical protein